MAAYFMVQTRVIDEAKYKTYRDAARPVFAKFGARQIVRAPEVETLEGHHDIRNLVVFEFPSLEAIHSFWDSPEYAPAKELRREAAEVDIWIMPGV